VKGHFPALLPSRMQRTSRCAFTACLANNFAEDSQSGLFGCLLQYAINGENAGVPRRATRQMSLPAPA
jgi:hypothetical protein